MEKNKIKVIKEGNVSLVGVEFISFEPKKTIKTTRIVDGSITSGPIDGSFDFTIDVRGLPKED